jgi:hypothetical protein
MTKFLVWLKDLLVLLTAPEVSVGLPLVPNLKTHALRTRSFLISIKKEAMLMMIMIDMFPASRLSFHREYHLRLQQPWTLKSWPCRFRCSRKCRRSIRNRRKRSSRRSISRRSAGRPNSILNLRPLVMGRDLPDLCRRTQRDSLRVVSDRLKTISSLLLIKVALLLTSISTSEVEQALKPRRQIQAHLRLKKQRHPLTLMISWTFSPLMHQQQLFNPRSRSPLPRLTTSLVVLISPLYIFRHHKLNNKIHSKQWQIPPQDKHLSKLIAQKRPSSYRTCQAL